MAFSVGTLIGYLQLEGGPQFDRGVGSAKAEMRSAAATAESLGVSVGMVDRALVGAGRQAGIASSGTAKFRAAQLSAVAATERYNAVLASENATTQKLASSEAALIRANEAVKRSTPAGAFASVNREATAASVSVGKTAGAFTRAARSAVGLGAAFGAFELARKAIDIGKEAATYQSDMTRIRALTGASAAEIRSMSSALLGLSGKLAASPEELALSLYHVEAIGLRGADALNAVTAAAMAARIGNAGLEETTNALTATIQSGIAKNQSYTATMQDLLTIVGTGDMKLSDFNDALATGALASLANFGLSLRDVGAAMAVFGDNNARGRDGLTKLLQAVQSLTVIAPKGQAALASIGLGGRQLAEDLQTGGLNKALVDLKSHLTAAGITGNKVGEKLLEIFTKKAGGGLNLLIRQLDIVHMKYDMLNNAPLTFEQRWDAVTKTTTFKLAALGDQFKATGIGLIESTVPAVGTVADLFATALPQAIHLAGAALTPFAAAWHLAGEAVGPVGTALGVVGDVLSPLAPLLHGGAVAALAMWVAFKVGTITINLVRDAVAATGVAVRNSAADFQVWRSELNATAAQSATAAAVMEADALAIGVAYAEEAAVIDRAAASQAVAFAAMMQSSETSSAAQIANADAAAAAALTQARASEVAAARTAAAAEESAVAVRAAGAGARAGWASLAGPIGIAAVGVFALVSMFHSSTKASKEATDAAKAYGDALKGDGGSRETILDTITQQLKDNNVPEEIDKLNKALGSTAFTGQQFTSAIMGGVPAMVALEQRLIAVQRAGTFQTGAKGSLGTFVKQLTPQAIAAGKLLRSLSDEFYGLNAATKKDLLDTKTFAGASSSLDKVGQKFGIATGTAKTYAAMVGIVADKNGVTTLTQQQLDKAVQGVSAAFAGATGTGLEYLGAVQKFSTSTGTAADRAALIGSTLKAANGDALNFASAMVGVNSANRAFVDGFQGDADKIAGIRQQIADLYSAANGAPTGDSGLATAQMTKTATTISTTKDRIAELNTKIASGTLTVAGLAAAHRSLANAQASLGVSTARLSEQQSKSAGGAKLDTTQLAALQKQLADAYANSEKAAIRLSDGAIDFKKGGAPALVSGLQAIQDAAVKSASALYQHEVRTRGGKLAADDAYNLYVTQTRGALEDEATKLGITSGQAKKLADRYFGMPGKVKTLIEQEGADPVLNVLHDIDRMLRFLATGKWDIPIDIDARAAAAKLRDLQKIREKLVPGSTGSASINKQIGLLDARANGGPVKAGVPYIVGEKRPEVFVPDVNGRIEPRVPMGSKTIKIEQTIVNPLPEPASVSGPAGLRRAALRLDGMF